MGRISIDGGAALAALTQRVAALEAGAPIGGSTVVPMEPVFNVGGNEVSIPSVAGVVYSIDGTPVTAGLHPVTPPATVVVTAAPAPGYAFPTSPIPVTEWTAEFTVADEWTEFLTDALASGSMASRTAQTGQPWLAPAGTPVINGGWLELRDADNVRISVDAGNVAHAAEVDYDLTGVNGSPFCGVVLVVNYNTWGRHNFKLSLDDAAGYASAKLSATGSAAHPVLAAAAGKALTGLPKSGTFRVETDGTNIAILIDGQVIATSLRLADNNPGWAGEPTYLEVAAVSESTSPTASVTKLRNVQGFTK